MILNGLPWKRKEIILSFLRLYPRTAFQTFLLTMMANPFLLSDSCTVVDIMKDELPRSVGSQYATGEEWKNNTRKNAETRPKQKQRPVVDVTGDGSKVRCCKEQYCTGTWNVRSMNQCKLKVVKQEMARVNVDILGISKLKWTRMGEFNSDDQYISYYGQESLRRNGVAIIANKSPKCSTWMQSHKRQNDLCSFPRQTIQYHGNPSLYPGQ